MNASDDPHRTAFWGTYPAEAPEIGADDAMPSNALVLSEGEQMLIYGLRLLRRAETEAVATVLERSALQAVSGMLEALNASCGHVMKSARSAVNTEVTRTGKSNSTSRRRRRSKDGGGGELQ